MATTTRTDGPPIYESLVEEFGDVLTETREAAERILREANAALDWRGPGVPQHSQHPPEYRPE